MTLIADMSYCYVCGRTEPLETHHCFHGTANRRLADEDGMVVSLCPRCHREVHRNAELDIRIKQEAQRIWMVRYHGTIEAFRVRYGKNYLEEEQ